MLLLSFFPSSVKLKWAFLPWKYRRLRSCQNPVVYNRFTVLSNPIPDFFAEKIPDDHTLPGTFPVYNMPRTIPIRQSRISAIARSLIRSFRIRQEKKRIRRFFPLCSAFTGNQQYFIQPDSAFLMEIFFRFFPGIGKTFEFQ